MATFMKKHPKGKQAGRVVGENNYRRCGKIEIAGHLLRADEDGILVP
jgi:hypothetical protein